MEKKVELLKIKQVFLLVFVLVISSVSAQLVDTDGDGMPDFWETRYGLNLNDPSDKYLDKDFDGLLNYYEYINGCRPDRVDTDADTFNDSIEVFYGTNCSKSTEYPTKALINITLQKPKYGVAPVTVFDFAIKSSNASQCKFTLNPNMLYDEIDNPANIFQTTDGFVHTIRDFQLGLPDNFEQEVYLKCKVNQNGYVNDWFPVKIILSVDRTPPVINTALADPNPVIENLEVTLKSITDDLTFCIFQEDKIAIIDTGFVNLMPDNFAYENSWTLTANTIPKIEDEKKYNFTVKCMNKAEWFSDTRTIQFEVNLSTPNKITELSPSGYTREPNIEIRVVTNKDSTCYYREGSADNMFPQQDAKVHFINRLNLAEGLHTYPIICIFNDLGNIETQISFRVDRTGPSNLSIYSEDSTCSLAILKANFTAEDNIDIKGYYYRVVNSNNAALTDWQFSSSKKVTESNLHLEAGKSYKWQVYAVDVADNNSTIATSAAVNVLNHDDIRCVINQAPQAIINISKTRYGYVINLTCVDRDGQCTERSYYLINSQTDANCRICGKCGYNDYNTTVTIGEDSTFCYRISDNLNYSVYNSIDISYIPCANAPDDCCLNDDDGVCDPDCLAGEDIDCSDERKDSDNDGMTDAWELRYQLDPYSSHDAQLDYDNDGLTNLEEFQYKTNPLLRDTDSDGFDDKLEIDHGSDPNNKYDIPRNIDSDGDGLNNGIEVDCGLDPFDPMDAKLDYDGDGLLNELECIIGSNIYMIDSDGDGYSDKTEYQKGTDWNNPNDFPKSHALSILSFFFGIIATVAGIILISQDKKVPFPASGNAVPLVDFQASQQELKKSQEQKTQIRNLDTVLKSKREQIKLRKINSIFDEFVQEPKPKTKKAIKTDNPLPEDKYSEDFAFNELDTIIKKKK